MVETRVILSNYFDILEENRTSKYLLCKYTPVSFKKTESTGDLWKKHDETLAASQNVIET